MASAGKMTCQCDLKPLTLGAVCLEPTHLSLAQPQRHHSWPRAGTGRGISQPCRLGMDEARCLRGPVLGSVLAWLARLEQGRFARWPRAYGGSGEPSLEKNCPFQAFLGVCGAISGGWVGRMPHHMGATNEMPPRGTVNLGSFVLCPLLWDLQGVSDPSRLQW